ncbi:MAG TPA: flagellar M-ring protein FliF C-terminal domain-containing protein, partial [Symbiobacteriaceae bacterium]|nr:flagellar M-ring protein FliF C-terminal domain-containing protein [Symbiobacteriaceae bacterium]
WSRPVGKWIISGIAGFIVVLAAMSYLWSRPTYTPLGRFDAADAPEVQKKLTDSKILFRQGEPSFTFLVQQGDLEKARLALAEIELDPTSTVWAAESWKGKTSWSDTEFDKRRLWEEQTEANLTRAIRTMSLVEQARVDISLPVDEKLFKEDQKPPKATVVVWPRNGQKITVQAVEAIMEIVSGAVEGLEKTAVTVVDSSTNRVVSNDAFKVNESGAQPAPGETAASQLAVLKQFQEYWQEHLTEKLQLITGPGKVSVIVNPSINWEQVVEEALEYGQNVPLSEQKKTHTAEGGGGVNTGSTNTGVTPNVESGIPGYPGTVNAQTGSLNEESVETITNYLVSQTKRITEKPGGSIEELSVGVFVDSQLVKPEAEQAIKTVVATALGAKATVEVAALPFAPGLFDDLGKTPEAPVATGTPWLYYLLVPALALGGIGLVLLAMRPRKPVLEPVFAGPEAAMMGGIPVADLEMAAAMDAYGAQAGPVPPEKRELEAEDIAAMAPEEIALLGDEFLHQLGVDPAKVRMREKVEKIAKANPEAVANLLKTWITEA